MAKKLLLDVLLKVLGEFIELNEENLDLSLAVWSGHIALKDLKVCPTQSRGTLPVGA